MSYGMEGEQHARKSSHMEIDRLSNLSDPIIHHILSFMETKYAVQTGVLSKKWRHHWTHIHSLNFDRESFHTWAGFRKFVVHVLHKRKPFSLCKLRFCCRCAETQFLVNTVFYYATLHRFEELETDVSSFPPSLYECQTLRTLKLGPGITKELSHSFGYASLTTLHLKCVSIENHNNDLFSKFLNLENLSLIHCSSSFMEIFKISAPRLITLTISRFIDCGLTKLVISAPRLKCFNLDGFYPPMLSMDRFVTLDTVNIFIDIVSTIAYRKQEYILSLIRLAEGLCHTKSLTVILNFFVGEFLLFRNNNDAEIKLVAYEKVIREEMLPFALATVRGLALDQFATIIEEMSEGKRSMLDPIRLQLNV